MSRSFFPVVVAGIVLAARAPVIGQEPQPRQPQSQPAVTTQQSPDLPSVEEQIVTRTNQFRRRHLRHALTVNAELSKAAQYFAKFLAQKDELSHTADGQQPWDRATKFGYQYCVVEENIAYEFNSNGFNTDQLAQALVKGWEESPGHRKNMLNQYVTETAVAVARSESSGKYYAVQMFGRPKSLEIEFQIVNETDAAVQYKLDDQPFTVQPHVRMTHRACTPPELKFDGAANKDIYHPENGGRFVIRMGREGGLTVSQSTK